MAFLLGLVYADCLRFFPAGFLRMVPASLARNHNFTRFNIWFALGGSNAWTNAYFDDGDGRREVEIGFSLLGLTSELGHLLAFLVRGPVQDESRERGDDRSYWRGVRSEMYDRMFVLTRKNPSRLSQRAASYVHHRYRYCEELIQHLAYLPDNEGSVEFLYDLFSRFNSWVHRGQIRDALSSGGLSPLTARFYPSQRYMLVENIAYCQRSMELGI